MTDKHDHIVAEGDSAASVEEAQDQALQSRRGFLLGLGKWSQAVIGAAVVGGALVTNKAAHAGWINRRGGVGGGWINGAGGGGGSWVNRRGGGFGGSWVNRR
jgi:hypothetical protein